MVNGDSGHSDASSVSPSWRAVADFLLVMEEAPWTFAKGSITFFVLVVIILSSLEKRIA